MEIAGSTAMWTRPDSGDSPVSYPAPTYSACKGIFESILFGPDVEIIPTRVEICAPVQFHSYATNYKGPLRQKKSIDLGNAYQMYSTVLIDVCYRLYAVVVPNHRKDTLSEKTLEWDRRTTSPGHAYQEIFNRRLQRGQCFAIPSLGLREFTASYFGPFRDGTKVCTDMEDIHIPSTLRQVFPKMTASLSNNSCCKGRRVPFVRGSGSVSPVMNFFSDSVCRATLVCSVNSR